MFDDDQHTTQVKRRLAKTPIQARLSQSWQGRNRAKEGPSTKCHGRVHLSEYSMSASEYSKSAASGKTTVPAYSLMVCHKVPARSVSHKMAPTTVSSRPTQTERLSSNGHARSYVPTEFYMIFRHHTGIPRAPRLNGVIGWCWTGLVRLSKPPDSESSCGHVQYATFALPTALAISQAIKIRMC